MAVEYHQAMGSDRDKVDEIIEQWQRVWPQLDVASREVLMRLTRIDILLERRSKAVLTTFGLTNYGFKLLAALRRAGPPFCLTPSELGRDLFVTSGTLTHQIDQLEAAGLVNRSPDPSDRRGVLVELTAKGRQRIEAALVAQNESDRQALTPLTEQEQQTAAVILRKVLRFLEDGALPESDTTESG